MKGEDEEKRELRQLLERMKKKLLTEKHKIAELGKGLDKEGDYSL